ncbi:MAG: sulfotransferase, partial [Candidatus Obscuribacterales bacterium]|nr:sulfotransferase [Candidatus Obscuribacterales bacterium]
NWRLLLMQKPDALTLFEIASSLKEPIAINFFGRSGSVFLQSLFDDHPDTITSPGVILWSLNVFHFERQELQASALVDAFMDYYAVLFDPSRPFKAFSLEPWENHAEVFGFLEMGPERNQRLALDSHLFKTTLLEILQKGPEAPSRKFFFQAVHVAYQHALGREVHLNSRIVFPLHQFMPSLAARLFASDFPDAYYIHTVREPLVALASLIKFNAVNNNVFTLLVSGEPLTPELGPRSRAIRLEDLHRDSEKLLEGLCAWLNLPFHQALLKSTFQGLSWWGDKGSPKLTGFHQDNTGKRHLEILPSIDVFRLKVLLAAKYKAWEYPLAEFYESFLIRLVCLPLLLLPLRCEIERDILLSKNLSTISFCRLCVREWLALRKHLFLAWLRCFFADGRQLRLLKIGND